MSNQIDSKKKSASEAFVNSFGGYPIGYALVTIFSSVLGIIFIIIDGMLLWAIGFFVLAIMLVLIRIMWENAVWLENVIRKLEDE